MDRNYNNFNNMGNTMNGTGVPPIYNQQAGGQINQGQPGVTQPTAGQMNQGQPMQARPGYSEQPHFEEQHSSGGIDAQKLMSGASGNSMNSSVASVASMYGQSTNGSANGTARGVASGPVSGLANGSVNGQANVQMPNGVVGAPEMNQANPQMGNDSTKKSGAKAFFGNFFTKTVAAALIFGLLGGGIFTGISYAGSKLTGNDSSGNGTVKTTATTKSSTKQTATGNAGDITDVSGVVNEVMPSIVAITNSGTVTYSNMMGRQGTYECESAGSGFIVSEDDEYLYIATNNHVVAGANELTVQFCDESVVEAEIRGTKPDTDLAVVRVKKADVDDETLNTIKIATIGDSDSLQVGNASIAIGNALGYGQTVTTGIVSALGRSVTTQDPTTGEVITNDNLIQTDAAINPGNSGGALLNAAGEVIGINSVKYSSTEVEGIGYAIPMSVAQPIIDSLIQNGEYVNENPACLGIKGGDVSSRMLAYGVPEGVYVSSVGSGSGAEAAGIKDGDIITAVDGTAIKGMDDLQQALKDKNPGDEVTITIARANNNKYENTDVKVVLSSTEDFDD